MIESPDKRIHAAILKFMELSEACDDWATGSLKATVLQFINNSCEDIGKILKRNNQQITPEQVLDIQVAQLRKCVADIHEVQRLSRSEN